LKNNINNKAIANQPGFRIKETKIHDRQIINKKFHRYLFNKTEKPLPQKERRGKYHFATLITNR
ncbi:TPA: hypothetical protein ACN751_005279, partial [Klebsiella pneumoniae]